MTSTPAAVEPAVADTRASLTFHASTPSPALAALRDALLDERPLAPEAALAVASVLLATHTRELAAAARQHTDDHRLEQPTGRSVRALRTGMELIRRLLDQQAARLDEQAPQ